MKLGVSPDRVEVMSFEAGSLKSRFKVKGRPNSPVSKEQVATAFVDPGAPLGGWESLTAVLLKDIAETAMACNSPEVAEIINKCGDYVWNNFDEFATLLIATAKEGFEAKIRSKLEELEALAEDTATLADDINNGRRLQDGTRGVSKVDRFDELAKMRAHVLGQASLLDTHGRRLQGGGGPPQCIHDQVAPFLDDDGDLVDPTGFTCFLCQSPPVLDTSTCSDAFSADISEEIGEWCEDTEEIASLCDQPAQGDTSGPPVGADDSKTRVEMVARLGGQCEAEVDALFENGGTGIAAYRTADDPATYVDESQVACQAEVSCAAYFTCAFRAHIEAMPVESCNYDSISKKTVFMDCVADSACFELILAFGGREPTQAEVWSSGW